MNTLPRVPLPVPGPPISVPVPNSADEMAWIGYEAALPWIRVSPTPIAPAPGTRLK